MHVFKMTGYLNDLSLPSIGKKFSQWSLCSRLRRKMRRLMNSMWVAMRAKGWSSSGDSLTTVSKIFAQIDQLQRERERERERKRIKAKRNREAESRKIEIERVREIVRNRKRLAFNSFLANSSLQQGRT